MPIASRTTTVSDTARMTRPTRALHVVPALFGEGGVFGGAERYALELARHMADQTPTRLVTFSETPAGNPSDSSTSGFSVGLGSLLLIRSVGSG